MPSLLLFKCISKCDGFSQDGLKHLTREHFLPLILDIDRPNSEGYNSPTRLHSNGMLFLKSYTVLNKYYSSKFRVVIFDVKPIIMILKDGMTPRY